MRLIFVTAALAAAAFAATPVRAQQPSVPDQSLDSARAYLGFDRDLYPGDAALPELRKLFSFTGYWLTNPPHETRNTWLGKRDQLLRAGFGFLIVANGRLDTELVRAAKNGKSPAALGRQDAIAATAAARREGFPAGAILFLDQEEGGRLLPEQAEYLLAWTEAVAQSAFLPGVYASGQPVADGRGPNGKPVTITTIEDIRVRVAAGHLHPIAFWVAQDACPPAPGCVLQPPPPSLSGTLDATAWQFAQSPRRKSITLACARTYASDGNCDTPAPARFDVDLTSAATPDPSHGR
ncbi:MAG: glycoside hydrolase domain-containing protein [Acidobacteriaceae bacterium]